MSTNALLEHRTDRLEEALARLADAQIETQFQIQSFKEENRVALKQYKEENRELLEKHKEDDHIALEQYKEENRELLEKHKEDDRIALEQYKEENRIALEEYKEENREEHRKINREFGRLSNKMGTIVEDMIYPAARPLISRYFNIDMDDIDIYSNISKKNKKRDREEFDVIAVTVDKVFLIEVKSTMRDSYVSDFKEKQERFLEFFPDYLNKKLIPVMASITMQPNTVNLLTINNMYAMAYREWDYMDILNFDKV